MNGIKIGAYAVGGLLLLGAANGGLVHRPDGSIDAGASISKSADRGAAQVGESVGSGLDTAAEAAGRGATSAVVGVVEGSAILSAPGDAIGAGGAAAAGGLGMATRLSPANIVLTATGLNAPKERVELAGKDAELAGRDATVVASGQ